MTGLLMTRSHADSERFLAGLAPAVRDSLSVAISPLIRIVPTGAEVGIEGVRGVIFTSSNAVDMAARIGVEPKVKCFCVGTRTTEVAQAAGWPASRAGIDAQSLIRHLTDVRPDAPLLHLRGVHVRGDVAGHLGRAGVDTREVAIYDQQVLPLSQDARQMLDRGDPVIVPLFSPRVARQFADHAGCHGPLYLAAMSQAVAEAVSGLEYKALQVADRPDAAAMARCVTRLAGLASRVEGRGEPQ